MEVDGGWNDGDYFKECFASLNAKALNVNWGTVLACAGFVKFGNGSRLAYWLVTYWPVLLKARFVLSVPLFSFVLQAPEGRDHTARTPLRES